MFGGEKIEIHDISTGVELHKCRAKLLRANPRVFLVDSKFDKVNPLAPDFGDVTGRVGLLDGRF